MNKEEYREILVELDNAETTFDDIIDREKMGQYISILDCEESVKGIQKIRQMILETGLRKGFNDMDKPMKQYYLGSFETNDKSQVSLCVYMDENDNSYIPNAASRLLSGKEWDRFVELWTEAVDKHRETLPGQGDDGSVSKTE